jgi:hypothetical protein
LFSTILYHITQRNSTGLGGNFDGGFFDKMPEELPVICPARAPVAAVLRCRAFTVQLPVGGKSRLF